MAAVILNATCIILEDWTVGLESNHIGWLLPQLVFASCFALEFALKYSVRGVRFFEDNMNTFDFLVMVMSVSRCLVDIGLYGCSFVPSLDLDLGQRSLGKITQVLSVC